MKFWHHLSISRRLIFSFAVAALFTALSSGLALLTFIDNKNALDKIVESYVPELEAAYGLATQARAVAAKSVGLIDTKIQSSRQSIADSVNDDIHLMDQMVSRLSSDNVKELNDLKKAKSDLLKSYQKLDQLVFDKIEINRQQTTNNKLLVNSYKEYNRFFNQRQNQQNENSFKESAKAIYSLIFSISKVNNRGQLKRIKKDLKVSFLELDTAFTNNTIAYPSHIKDTIATWQQLATEEVDLKTKEFKIIRGISGLSQVYDRNAKWLAAAAYAVINSVDSKIESSSKSSLNSLRKNGITLIAITIFCTICSFMLAFSIGRNIGSRIETLQHTMDLHAQGEQSSSPISVSGKDEIGKMANALKVFITKIKNRESDLHIANEKLEEKLSELNIAQTALRENEQRFKDFAGVAADWFWEMNAELKFNFVKGAALEVAGIISYDLIGKTLQEVINDKADMPDLSKNRHFDDFDVEWPVNNGKAVFFRISGKPLFDDNKNFLGYRGTGSDITEAKQLSAKLLYQANHDALTNLMNRNAFEQSLSDALTGAEKHQSVHALCYLDLDQFKVINDTCGHAAGDELLRQISHILTEKVRKGDTVARLGGDEFGILLENCSINVAKKLANKLREAIHNFRFSWSDRNFSVGVSIGVVPIDQFSMDATELMKSVDAACYAAKDQGRNRVHVFTQGDEELNKRQGEMQWVSTINRALDDNRFFLTAQPICPINGQNIGYYYEILLRMKDEEGELVMPSSFLPAAERYGLAPRLDLWVVNSTLVWLSKNPQHLENLHLCSINLSAHSLLDDTLFDNVSNIVKQTGVPCHKICFEITETAAITNLMKAKKLIESLQVLGFKFALDDFGSGFSWFGSLKDLPVDYLKIDGSFVRDIKSNPVHRAIVSSINDIGKLMHKNTIAEFVEDYETIAILKKMGVDFIQGYAISAAKPLNELPALLDSLPDTNSTL